MGFQVLDLLVWDYRVGDLDYLVWDYRMKDYLVWTTLWWTTWWGTTE